MRSENVAKNCPKCCQVRLPKFEPVNGISWSPRKIMVKDLRQRSELAWYCACAESCVVFNTGPYTVLPDNSILITANMQSETGFPSSHQLKSYVASKSRLKLTARAVLSADAGLLVARYSCSWLLQSHVKTHTVIALFLTLCPFRRCGNVYKQCRVAVCETCFQRSSKMRRRSWTMTTCSRRNALQVRCAKVADIRV